MMLRDILLKQNIRIEDGAEDWKQAVHLSMEPLLLQGFITQRYVDTIINLTEQYGAYYLLTPAIALLHARPEDGVEKTQMAVTLLKTPVLFKNKSIPTKLLISLATADANSHLDALAEIGILLDDEEKQRRLLNAKDSDTLYANMITGLKDHGRLDPENL
ncbi:MAG: transcriptional regulator [Firmicutes bacterium]|nr:transcriptional regulator [Bacillota bacterium]